MATTRLSLPITDGPVDAVTAAVHRPNRAAGPGVLLVPGAGGDLDGAGLVALADVLATAGCTVVRANLPYRQAGRSTPRAEATVPAYADVFAAARAEVAPRRSWVAGGKSYGGRVASLAVAADAIDVIGLLFYGYPLHPPGKPTRLRTDHWHRVNVPTLFLQGSHDTFGSPGDVEQQLPKLPRRATLVNVEGGDHSLGIAKVRAPDGVRRSAAEVIAGLAEPVTAWVRSLSA